jgi:hypothetical protein
MRWHSEIEVRVVGEDVEEAAAIEEVAEVIPFSFESRD